MNRVTKIYNIVRDWRPSGPFTLDDLSQRKKRSSGHPFAGLSVYLHHMTFYRDSAGRAAGLLSCPCSVPPDLAEFAEKYGLQAKVLFRFEVVPGTVSILFEPKGAG